ncbi:MAG: family transcriptional regulator [Eubacterium sp.]|nr:family transcriptional regulator [Eubacterium sp.]
MINKVGEKIKATRKALNMTQSELAGSDLTKSMLSQIENNVSNPSFKTLQYLAGRLNKPVSYFLDDDSLPQTNSPLNLDGNNNVIETITALIDDDKLDAAQDMVSDYAGNEPGNSKITAALMFKLGSRLLKKNKISKGRDYLGFSIDMYSKAKLNIEAAKACIELAFSYYQEFDYPKCCELSDKAFDLYNKEINKDPLFEIELYYYKILILFAIGDIKNASIAISESIHLSSQTSVYFKTGELYRLNAIFTYLTNNTEEYHKCIEKATQFARFTEDNICLGKIYSVKALFSLDNNNWEEALECAKNTRIQFGRETYIYYLITGKALFLAGKYQQAYENIIKVDYPSSEKHKFDYLNMWSSKVYEGMILNKLGRYDDAVAAVKIGIERMSLFKESKFLLRAYKALSDIYSEANDFKNAFIYLKSANELQEKINNDKNILF